MPQTERIKTKYMLIVGEDMKSVVVTEDNAEDREGGGGGAVTVGTPEGKS